MILFLTALAGGVGGVLRFLVDTGVSRINRLRIPLGTVLVNTTACFALGLLSGFAMGFSDSETLQAVVGVGLLGGYSTFSTATVEGVRLLRARRSVAALIHSGGMLLLSLVLGFVGLVIGSALP
jgi:CrcB protein